MAICVDGTFALGKARAPAEAIRHMHAIVTLSIVGRAQSVLAASVCGLNRGFGTMARFGPFA